MQQCITISQGMMKREQETDRKIEKREGGRGSEGE